MYGLSCAMERIENNVAQRHNCSVNVRVDKLRYPSVALPRSSSHTEWIRNEISNSESHQRESNGESAGPSGSTFPTAGEKSSLRSKPLNERYAVFVICPRGC